MNTIRISRLFEFNASHALRMNDGRCKPIHGHCYKLTVTLLGEPNPDGDDHNRGMVINFSDLSHLVDELIISIWEGALLLHEDAPAGLIESWKKIDKRLVLLPYQPTCENLLLDIRQKLLDHMPEHLVLHSLRLAESDTAYVEWHASDNILDVLQQYADDCDDNEFVQDCLNKANTSQW